VKPAWIFTAFLFLGLPSILEADPGKSGDKASSAVFADLLRCRSEPTDAARWACFDRAVEALASAAEQGSVVVVDREQVRRTRRSLFGFNLPSLPFFSGDNSANDQPDEIESVVQSVGEAGHGKLTMTLRDGGTWQTTEAMVIPPSRGATVRVKKAALGSYFIIYSGRAVRAVRLR
jgi:hypothetical protein